MSSEVNSKSSSNAFNEIGFGSLPDQLVASALRRGFYLNFLCVGQPGIGKTALLSSLFQQNMDETFLSESLVGSLLVRKYCFSEGGTNLDLSTIETTKFAYSLNKSDCIDEVIKYIEDKYQKYISQELQSKRCLPLIDERVHLCIYMISPMHTCLQLHDIVALRKLQSRVNVVPVIARADTFTTKELAAFKTRINDQLTKLQIKLYRFPVDDAVSSVSNITANGQIPFALVSTKKQVAPDSKSAENTRVYPWGTLRINNPHHCETTLIRDSIIRTNLFDIINSTISIHYENFRHEKLESTGIIDLKSYQEWLNKQNNGVDNYENNLKTQITEQCNRNLSKKLSELSFAKKEIEKNFEAQKNKLEESMDNSSMDTSHNESQQKKRNKGLFSRASKNK